MKSRFGKNNDRYELDRTQKQNYSSQNKGKIEVGSGTPKLCNFCGYAWPHFGGQENALRTKANVESQSNQIYFKLSQGT